MGQRGADKKVRDERILLEFLLNDGPAFTTAELTASLPYSRQQVNNRLDAMEDMGLVRSKKASGRRLWWITDDGRNSVAETARALFD